MKTDGTKTANAITVKTTVIAAGLNALANGVITFPSYRFLVGPAVYRSWLHLTFARLSVWMIQADQLLQAINLAPLLLEFICSSWLHLSFATLRTRMIQADQLLQACHLDLLVLDLILLLFD